MTAPQRPDPRITDGDLDGALRALDDLWAGGGYRSQPQQALAVLQSTLCPSGLVDRISAARLVDELERLAEEMFSGLPVAAERLRRLAAERREGKR